MWDLYILLKSVLKMLEMPFQRPQIQNISRGYASVPHKKYVVTLAWPPLFVKTWSAPDDSGRCILTLKVREIPMAYITLSDALSC